MVLDVGGCVQGGGGANAARPKVRYHLHRILVLITVFCAAFVLLLSVHAILNGASLLRHTISLTACGRGGMAVRRELQDAQGQHTADIGIHLVDYAASERTCVNPSSRSTTAQKRSRSELEAPP